MNIGEAASRSGVSAKMIRHYESIGLIPPAIRSEAGYRNYSENDVNSLRFIRAARDLGFGLDTIGELLSLWRDRGRASRNVRALAVAHIAALKKKAANLQQMIATLQALVEACHGDHRPDCPILEGMERSSESPAAEASSPPKHRTGFAN
jgi:Cu(I)-responsive transcriptional regulator